MYYEANDFLETAGSDTLKQIALSRLIVLQQRIHAG